jgi:uncharacterized protein (TIGR00369 family)
MADSGRTRTFTWQDPLATAGHALKLSGLGFLQAIASGKIPKPPIAEALDFTLAEVSEGLAVFTVEPKEFHYNPIGVVHGGLAATILDSAMACSVQTILPAGKAYTTLELKVNLVRAITLKAGLLRAEGRLIHSGSRVATAEGRLVDKSGRLYAHGTTTCMIFDAPAS